MKRYTYRISNVVFATLLMISGFSFSFGQAPANRHEVNHIIFMIPDGMGLADVTATRIQKNGIAGPPLYLETLERIGYHRTYSEDSTITDSAAAGSAMACGEKFKNGEVCLHNDGRPHNASILELAKAKGLGTGLVATSTITHATPATFGSHVGDRGCEQEIARQYIRVTHPDVILGGGLAMFTATSPDDCGAYGNFVSDAEAQGYKVIYTQQELANAVSDGAAKLLGLFNNDALTPEIDRGPGITEPRLPDMTRAALATLDKNQQGFFLMIEGSQVDWANHDNNYNYQYGEMVAFDESVKAVLDWINASPERKQHTLLIITGDHETGGFAVGGGEGVALGIFDPAWVTGDHTGGDIVTWSQGPGSEFLGKSIDNTEIYEVMRFVLK